MNNGIAHSNQVFILTNKKQRLGAVLSKFSIEEHLPSGSQILISILTIEDEKEFQQFIGASFPRGTETRTYTFDDLQSFTLGRFLPPQKTDFSGIALVIDPDIFALGDISPIFETALDNAPIAARPKPGNNQAYESSVMLLDCVKLPHWNVQNILQQLKDKEIDYAKLTTLQYEKRVVPLGEDWNSFDQIKPSTKLLHTTNRLTQPWKTGLPIDFTRNQLPRIAGIIPREWVHVLLGKRSNRYLPHPDKSVEFFFMQLLKRAIEKGIITKAELEEEVRCQHVRADIFKILATLKG